VVVTQPEVPEETPTILQQVAAKSKRPERKTSLVPWLSSELLVKAVTRELISTR
jgi:hypothetical protein